MVIKDVKQEFVDAGLDKAREVTEGQLASLVAKEKITAGAGRAQARGDPRPDHGHHRVRGLRRRRLRGRGRARADGDQAGGVRRARRGDARATRSSRRTPRRCRSPRSASATTRPDKVVGFHFFYPGLGDAADRGRRGRGDLRGDGAGGRQLRDADPQEPDPLRRGARASWSTGSSTRRRRRSGATQDETGARPRRSTRRSPRPKVTPMGPFFLSDLLGLDTVLHVAEHLQTSYGDRFYVHPEMKELVEAGNLGQKTGKGFYDPRRLRWRASDRLRDRRVVERFQLKAFVEAVHGGRRGRRRHQGRRPRDDDGRRHPARPAGPRRRGRPRRDARARSSCAEREWGDGFAPPPLLRRLVEPGPARQEDRPGLLLLPAARRRLRAEGDRAARDARRASRSSGSTAPRPTRSRRR